MMGAIPYRLDVLKKMLETGRDVHYPNANSGKELLAFTKYYRAEREGFKEIIGLMEQYAWIIGKQILLFRIRLPENKLP